MVLLYKIELCVIAEFIFYGGDKAGRDFFIGNLEFYDFFDRFVDLIKIKTMGTFLDMHSEIIFLIFARFPIQHGI